VEEGSLYPALQRMFLKGWLDAEWAKRPRIGALAFTHYRKKDASS